MSTQTNDVVVHQFSTLVNADKLSPEQLRVEVKRMGEELFAKDCQLAQQKEWLHKLHRMLATVCELRLANRYGDLHAEIDRMAEHYKATLASAQAERKVH